MKEKINLSICIPTYNRCSKVVLLVKSIIKSTYDNIEIIVLDNCSTDNTEYEIKKLNDKRIKYFKNSEQLEGMSNILTSMKYASGDYSLLCLDKDFILHKNLSNLINKIYKNNLVAGICSLNLKKTLNDIIYENPNDSLFNIAYTSEHPSGIFFDNNILKKENIIDNLLNKYRAFPFLPELIKAEVSLYGKTARINLPIIFTESPEDCEKQKSHTYRGDNIYFFPKNILKIFDIYFKSIMDLKTSEQIKIKNIEKIYISLLLNSTIRFKKIMRSSSICSHHYIETRRIGIIEILKYYIFFNINFLITKTELNLFYKAKIFMVANLKYLYILVFKNSKI